MSIYAIVWIEFESNIMSKNPFEQKNSHSNPSVVPETEIDPRSDLGTRYSKHFEGDSTGTMSADMFMRLMDNGPKQGESEANYRERMRVYRQRLEEDDHMDAKYPPSSVR